MHDLTALRLNRQIDPKRSQQSRRVASPERTAVYMA